MKTHERSLRVNAAPRAIWRIWSDPSTWPDWNPNVRSMDLQGPFATGSSGTMRTPGGQRHTMRLVSVLESREFVMETKVLPATTFVFRCAVEPDGADASRISQSIGMRGALAPVFSAMAGARIAASFDPLLQGLAAKAEAAEAEA